MKTVIFAAMAAACVLSTPALAQEDATFSGPRVEALAGYDSVKTNSNGLGSPGGFLYGVGLGYDLRAGGAVIGAEAELSDSTASRAVVGGDVDAARDIYIGGRIGVPVGTNLLAYAKAGYTNARVNTPTFRENGDGVRVGGGLEYDLGNKLYVKAEYRYSNYEQDIERHQVVGGVGVRF
ncbi:MAG: porin family protein [Sphingobium sp.]|nr:porin family protein [Sphingobium sp.]